MVETYGASGKAIVPELIPQVPQTVASLQVGLSFAAIPVPDPPLIRRRLLRIFSDNGLAGASHHAVIPNRVPRQCHPKLGRVAPGGPNNSGRYPEHALLASRS
jgi:hypothetical protein